MVSPIRGSSGEILGGSVIARDISDRKQLEQLRDQVGALLAALPPPTPAPVAKAKPDRSPYLAGLPEGPRGGGSIEWKQIRQGDKLYGQATGQQRLCADSSWQD